MLPVSPKKSLGQNFLLDSNIADRIVGFFDVEGEIILEVGGGTGFLTTRIIKLNPKKLVVIEKDSDLAENLKKIEPDSMVLNEDALNLNLSKIHKKLGLDKNEKFIVISNLPYNTGTRILLNLIEQFDLIKSMTIMLQLEVVNRFCAKPMNRNYGRISVLSQSLFDVEKKFEVAGECFYPIPKVTSAVMKLVPKKTPITKEHYGKLDYVTKLFFSMKRKTIKSILKKKNITFEHKLIKERTRAEELNVDDFILISKSF